MRWRNLREYLLPKDEQRDPGFRRELDRLSVVGLRVIAGVSIGAPLFVLAMGLIWVPEMQRLFQFEDAFAILLLGGIVLGLSFWPRMTPYARLLGMVEGYLVYVVQRLSQAGTAELVYLIPANITMIMLVGIAALPIKPLQVVGLGGSMLGTHIVLTYLLYPSMANGAELSAILIVVLQVLLICVALTAVVYHQRARAYRARREAEESFEDLRQAQSRLLMTENAASQGRFAAALSHELNSPMGALSSALDTLLLAYEKIETHPERIDELGEVIKGATSSARESRRRLMGIMERMKHLTNLDRAEEQSVDLNELWRSTVALLHGELERRANVQLELEPLPRFRGRPQQLSAVFSNLLRNSAESMDGVGTIEVRSVLKGKEVVLEVRDDGRGISADRLRHIFDPSFRVEGNRVSTSNWGLFISRSIIIEHGGRIEIDSTEGLGTTARISLPVPTPMWN